MESVSLSMDVPCHRSVERVHRNIYKDTQINFELVYSQLCNRAFVS